MFSPPVFSPELEMNDCHVDDSSKRVMSEVQVENPQIHKAPQYYAGKCLLFIIISINIKSLSISYYNKSFSLYRGIKWGLTILLIIIIHYLMIQCE